MNKGFPLFSNGTEFMLWQTRNCEKCVKAVFYNEKKDYYPKYRCAIQRDIEEAFITDGCGNKRCYDATHQRDCPYRRTEKHKRTKKEDKNQLNLFCD